MYLSHNYLIMEEKLRNKVKKKFVLCIALLLVFVSNTITLAKAQENNQIAITITGINGSEKSIEESVSSIIRNMNYSDEVSLRQSINQLIELESDTTRISFEKPFITEVEKVSPQLSDTIENFNNKDELLIQPNIPVFETNDYKYHVRDYVEKHVGASIFGIQGDIIAKIRCDVEWWYWRDTGHITDVLPRTTFYDLKLNATCDIIWSYGNFTPNNQVYSHNVGVLVKYGYDPYNLQATTDLKFSIVRGNIFNESSPY